MSKLTIAALVIWFAMLASCTAAAVYSKPIWWKWFAPTAAHPVDVQSVQPAPSAPRCNGFYILPGDMVVFGVEWTPRPDGTCHDEDAPPPPQQPVPKGPRT
jgi:hypothetical protein